jgi:hypothetical protein
MNETKHVHIVWDSTQSHSILEICGDGGTPSSLIGSTSMRVYVRKAADSWIFLRSYLGFCYVCTGFYESIYDTSITKVVDIPHGNSSYCVACARTWILEPSVYLSGREIKWQAYIVAYSCD